MPDWWTVTFCLVQKFSLSEIVKKQYVFCIFNIIKTVFYQKDNVQDRVEIRACPDLNYIQEKSCNLDKLQLIES